MSAQGAGSKKTETGKAHVSAPLSHACCTSYPALYLIPCLSSRISAVESDDNAQDVAFRLCHDRAVSSVQCYMLIHTIRDMMISDPNTATDVRLNSKILRTSSITSSMHCLRSRLNSHCIPARSHNQQRTTVTHRHQLQTMPARKSLWSTRSIRLPNVMVRSTNARMTAILHRSQHLWSYHRR